MSTILEHRASARDLNKNADCCIGSLLASGQFADLVITCKDRKWAVHRAIICSRSGFFNGACRNWFKEAHSGIIDLSEDDEEAVERMVRCKLPSVTDMDIDCTVS